MLPLNALVNRNYVKKDSTDHACILITSGLDLGITTSKNGIGQKQQKAQEVQNIYWRRADVTEQARRTREEA